jgi:hypothetical protein
MGSKLQEKSRQANWQILRLKGTIATLKQYNLSGVLDTAIDFLEREIERVKLEVKVMKENQRIKRTSLSTAEKE